MLLESQVERGRHLWAKSGVDGEGHSLLAHLLDVGVVAGELLRNCGAAQTRLLSEELGLSYDDAFNLQVSLVALHDLGKATPCFQAKWPPGAPAEALSRSFDDVPHGRAGGILLRQWLCSVGIKPRLATSLAHAVAIHHGQLLPKNFAGFGTYDPRSLGEDQAPWEGWRSGIIQDVLAAFGPLPELTTKRALRGRSWALLAGLTSVADWIGSSLTHVGEVLDVEAYVAQRRLEVRARLAEIAWPVERPWWRTSKRGNGFGSRFGEGFVPRPLQRVVEQLTSGLEEPTLLLVEAPMGEGKTEAAFYTMVQPHAAQGGYIALPTQATSDAMHERLRRFTEANRAREVDVALAHSTARQLAMLRSPEAGAAGGDQEAKAVAESWFAAGRRELLAELGVGTVDQALLGVLPTRHFFVRLWGLAGKVVILDEVHAYDAYTQGLVAELVSWLAAVGSSVVLMSATLPEAARNRLLEAYYEGLGQEATAIPDLEYPRAVRASASGVQGATFRASQASTVRLRSAPYDAARLAAELLAAVEGGAAVAAVVNDVGRAQELYRLCSGQHDDVSLVHARFPLAERKRREAELVARYGPMGDPARRNGLVIATQVVEQSLDLDFDVLYTDLAPVDLIFQRAGRMHRHAREGRPEAYREPTLHVSGLRSEAGSGPQPEALDSVYNAFVLWRSWGALTQREELHLPHDIDALVQNAYSEEPLPALEAFAAEVSEAAAAFRVEREAAVRAAEHWSLGAPLKASSDSWGEGGRDPDDWQAHQLMVPTRLGDDSVSAVPLEADGAGWRIRGGTYTVSERTRRIRDEFVREAVSQQLRVARKSLVAKLRSQEFPAWWSNTGPLRRFVPLLLDPQGQALIDPSVRFDDELGLVYEKGDKS